ncbi:serine hydrolase domain-containing protein [Sphingopyxis chilensis]|uniref:serine hydrolase domain-containing protein n=1 Tax=Sphingopyxis chilensis TaxID=180400 RepID=UPI002DDD8C4D|nr:serine hydrolase domain-containing protein [Sphingopyxis chilensis]
MVDIDATHDFESALRELAASLGVTGASFAYWDGMQMRSAVAGVRNSVTGDAVTIDTVMHIGSITKLMNAVLFLQLVDDGLMDLDDPVTKHVPELRLRDESALGRITCRMLINHTSGIDCDMLTDHGADQERIVDLVARCGEVGQLHAPGEDVSYSNLATCIAGYVTQKLRGRSWYELVKERIFKPLGLLHALVDITEVPRFRCSVGDIWDYAEGRNIQTSRPFLPLSFASCGTTAMMSAGDLVTFARALVPGDTSSKGTQLLSRELSRAMTRPSAKLAAMDASWGLGWLVMPSGVLWHGGAGPGVASVLYAHEPTGRVMALLTNCDRGGRLHAAMCEPIISTWTGNPVPGRTPQASMPRDLKPYTGVFGNNLQFQQVEIGEEGLTLRSGMDHALYDRGDRLSPAVRLFPIGEHRFEMFSDLNQKGAEFLFSEPDRNGQMTKLHSGVRLFRRRTLGN